MSLQAINSDAMEGDIGSLRTSKSQQVLNGEHSKFQLLICATHVQDDRSVLPVIAASNPSFGAQHCA
jgi:hypothetical protein